MLTWENPPTTDDAYTLTRDDVAKMLMENAGRWAIVARHDRSARAAAHVKRIESGREYGDGFESVARRIGNEHRVYARRVL